jgi:TRAP-type C4-dicarboxylate transport system permease small subunit
MMLSTLVVGLDRFNTITTSIAGKIATLALVIMTTIVTIHVITRYGFNYSFVWTEEIARILMVWMTFLYFPTGHKKGMNIAVEFAVHPWAHTLAGKLLKLALEVLAIVVLLVCFKLSLAMVGRGMHTSSQALQMTLGYVYMVVPVCFAITLLCAVENMLRILATLAGIDVPAPAHETNETTTRVDEALRG